MGSSSTKRKLVVEVGLGVWGQQSRQRPDFLKTPSNSGFSTVLGLHGREWPFNFLVSQDLEIAFSRPTYSHSRSLNCEWKGAREEWRVFITEPDISAWVSDTGFYINGGWWLSIWNYLKHNIPFQTQHWENTKINQKHKSCFKVPVIFGTKDWHRPFI